MENTTTTNKVTKRRAFVALREELANGIITTFEDAEGTFSVDEVITILDKAVEQLDNKNEKAKERAAAKKAEGDELREQIFGILGDEYKTLADIEKEIGNEEITKSKIVARLTQLCKAGKVEKADIKAGEGRKVKGYKVIAE